jgi:signal transduction histidine kinase
LVTIETQEKRETQALGDKKCPSVMTLGKAGFSLAFTFPLEGGLSSMNTAQILLVDDDPMLLQALPPVISLRMSGVEVVTADTAHVALAMIQQQEYDTVVSDIKMPGMDGLDLLAQIQAHAPETPVLLITGHGEHDLAMRALRGGAYDYLQKPIDRDDFLASLQRALHTRQLRRQIAEQQSALERSALSLVPLVEQRTRELVAANAAKDRVLRMVTHELTPPLTSLKGMTQLVDRQVQRGDGVEQVRKTLQDIGDSHHRLEVLVQDLQDTALIQAHRFVVHCIGCDLIALCQHVLHEYTAGGGTAPVFEVRTDQLEAEVDRERMSQVLLNLLSNARKYSPQEAPITVTLQQREAEAIISVRDQGVGIPAEELPHIYEPFYRVPGIRVQEGSSAGLGVGLSIAHTIVEQHGGRLEVQSHPGQGSTFSVVLPLLA